MPTPTTYPTALQAVGWAVEPANAQGTAVTPITWTNPIDSFDPSDKVTKLEDKAMRSSMVDLYGRQNGPIHVEWEMQGPAFMDGLPYLLKNILGDETATGTAPTLHALSVLNSGTAQPTSLTMVHYQGMPATTHARIYTGCVLSELTIAGNSESSLITYDAKGMGWASSVYPTTPPVFAPSVVAPQAAWRYQVGVGGTVSGAPNKTIRDFSVTIARALRVENTLQNSQLPFIIQRGTVTMTGSFSVTVPADETFLTQYLAGTQPQLQILGGVGTGATAYGLQLDTQLADWDSVDLKTDEEALGYAVAFSAIGNTTNAGASGGFSVVKATVSNQTAGAY